MEYQISKQQIQMDELSMNQLVEQSVEMDYMLPDYCADVFKVLKVDMHPHILSEHISGNKLLIDGVCDIKIIYLGGEDNKMNCIEQKQVFSKTLDLKEQMQDAVVTVRAKCDYVNCRAQSSRRLDIRGAIGMQVQIYHNSTVDVACGCDELQVHKTTLTTCHRLHCVSKEFTIKEELLIGSGKPPIAKVLHYNAEIDFTDYKVIANKIVCKGVVQLHMLYLDESMSAPEIMEHELPLSQIIDCVGVEEEYLCNCRFDIVKYDIDLQLDAENRCNSFIIEIGVRAYCEAAANKQVEVVDDCYSTTCEVENKVEQFEIERIDRIVQHNHSHKHTFKHNLGEVSSIYDLFCTVGGTSIKAQDGKLVALSNLQISALACDADGLPFSLEQNIPCEIELHELSHTKPISFSPTIRVISCGYHILSPNEIELRIELKIRGILYQKDTVKLITKITPNEEAFKQRKDNAALRLYFADEGENIWHIAKRYNTSVSAILENNSIEEETLASRGMIFIPIVD